MSQSKRTTDHEQIRRWVEARNGKPARVQGTGTTDDAGLLRIDFPEKESAEEDDELEEISWDEFFDKFDDGNLVFIYQENTARGQQSNFNKFARPENIDERNLDDDQIETRRSSRAPSRSPGSRSQGSRSQGGRSSESRAGARSRSGSSSRSATGRGRSSPTKRSAGSSSARSGSTRSRQSSRSR